MSAYNWKEIRFDIWCQTCVYKDIRDDKGEEPCNRCLTESARIDSTKPVEYRSNLGKSTRGN